VHPAISHSYTVVVAGKFQKRLSTTGREQVRVWQCVTRAINPEYVTWLLVLSLSLLFHRNINSCGVSIPGINEETNAHNPNVWLVTHSCPTNYKKFNAVLDS